MMSETSGDPSRSTDSPAVASIDPGGVSPSPAAVERMRISAALVVLVLLVAVTWMVYRPIGDMYVALAAGRDIVDGKLAEPDGWSFLTTDRVWINQNWGTHLTYYLTYSAAGETGMLVLKGVILSILVTAIVLSSRQRNVRWSTALLVAGAMLIAGRSYIDPRPNLTTLMMAPLMAWLLYRTRRDPRRIVWAVLVAWAWASSHGGFVFGLGMMGLWMGCQMLWAVVRDGVGPGLRRTWPLAAGTLAATVLSMVSPFGVENLTHPFLIAGSEKWRQVSEWRPLLDESSRFGTKWEFLTVLGVLVGVLAIRGVLLALAGARSSAGGRAKELSSPPVARSRRPMGTWAFEALLSAVVIAMAFKSRRFVPLALVVLAPVVALQIDRLLSRLPRAVDTAAFAAVAVAVAIPAVMFGRTLSTYYRSNHPTLPDESTFQRMVATHRLCPDLAEFVNANDISGRVYQEWRWEGYLRWRCPQLELYVGGRAQQVYTEAQDERRLAILTGPMGRYLLKDEDIRMVMVPNDFGPRGTYSRLMASLGLLNPSPENPPHWAFLYCDEDAMMLVDTRDPNMAELIEQADAGQLTYPSPFAEAFSRAMRLKGRAAEPRKVFRAFAAANEHKVTFQGYEAIFDLVSGQLTPAKQRLIPKVAEYFEEQLLRLSEMSPIRPRGFEVLRAGMLVAQTLEQIHRMRGETPQARQVGEIRDSFERMAKELVEAYR
jgi:hypothetical protein